MTTPRTVTYQNGLLFPQITYPNPFEIIRSIVTDIIYAIIKPLEISLQANFSNEFIQLPKDVQNKTFITTLLLLKRLPTNYIPKRIILDVDPEDNMTPTIVLEYPHPLNTKEESTILKIISHLKYELLTEYNDPSALLTQIVLEYP